MTVSNWVDLVIKVVVALGGIGGVTAFFMVRAQRNKLIADTGKTEAEAESLSADAYLKQQQSELNMVAVYRQGVQDLQRDLAKAEAKIDEQGQKIDALTEYIETLIHMIRENTSLPVPPRPQLRLVPPPTPPQPGVTP